MLLELHVRNLALVEEVWLEFSDGLTVLTGETGAGKTVLVGALQLLLGERADTTLVRSGADEALIEGRFLIDGEERLVRRRISAEGRSRCTIDDEMATVGALSELLGGIVDLHGQHEHQALLSVSRHAEYFDRFIGDSALDALAVYRQTYAERQAAVAELAALEDALADRDRRIDYLRFQIADIDAVSARVGEDAEIEFALPRMRHGDRLTSAASAAWSALEGDEAAAARLGEALGGLHRAAGLDPTLDGIASELEDAVTSVDGIASRLRDYAESVEHDPRALETAEDRLAALTALKKKYGDTLESVLAIRDAASLELEQLGEGTQALRRAEELLGERDTALREAGSALAEIRSASTSAFEHALTDAARDLAFSDARFVVQLQDLPAGSWTSDGPQRVEFLFSSSAGDTPRPLAKIASGGEISRVMLALKDVLGHADHTPVLVFDEVDAGIGGATAIAVGRRLASLADTHQVLVVTHLAQVAAFAAQQVVVEKDSTEGRSVTVARPVGSDERIAEIARMLSGGTTATGLEHARELLAMAASA
ncbi:MAG: DNA repair protein RecN [Actinobacteria bacterium HGW-Actinobacteria-1]|jgi:DNA repair protein RecN (Recombination protein N)|nr:MAG: DNA repair protein RecN [Actinobacteria bacterium HGW-Actinobacteria-1]